MRHRHANRIAALDPQRDCQEIVYLLACYEFPWDIRRALELALFRTYAVPSISGLLAKTGEFIRRPRKRYDDTELLLSEVLEHGLDSRQGKAALARINRMHGRFPIANRDFLYVLSTFVLEPARWLDRFGWRPLTGRERLALFHYYRELGRRLNIADLPADYADIERFNRDFERTRFRYAESNRAVGARTRDLLLGFYLPRRMVPLGRPIAHCLMDPPLLLAMGFRAPPALLRHLVQTALRLRAWMLRYWPERHRPRRLTQVERPTYPEGYRIEELGVHDPKDDAD